MSQNTPANHLISVFEAQKKHQYIVANQSVRQRKEKLKKLKRALEITFRQQIREALHADMNKPIAETDLIEIYPVVSEIKLALKNLKSWTKNHLVDTPLAFLGSRSYIAYEPKGVCLIISPWNYPVNLTLGPLVSAIAAGNTVLIKPSEHTPHTSALLQKIIASLFDEQEVAVMEGGVETSRELLKLPFDHIFFTGSPDVGKHVMAAAAQNLASVTLELGGKSPTIVDQTASVKTAARRIAWGKFVNCGQTCIAPDYVFVHHAIADSFLEALTQSIATLYDREDAFTTDYARIATQKHTERLTSLLDDAKSRGAEIVTGAPSEAISRLIKPIVLKNVNPESELMHSEIFGPILPILTYESLDEAITFINKKDKPLALYIYSHSKKNTNYILKNTRAGGTCINHNDIHFFNGNLPFGGVNHSGIGKSHGHFGFLAFSNERAVYRQLIPGALELLMPPYTKWKLKLIELTIKWF